MENRQKVLQDWIGRNFKIPANLNNTKRVQDIDLVRFFEQSNPGYAIDPEELCAGFRAAGFKVHDSIDLGVVININRSDYRTALRRYLR